MSVERFANQPHLSLGQFRRALQKHLFDFLLTYLLTYNESRVDGAVSQGCHGQGNAYQYITYKHVHNVFYFIIRMR